MTHSFENKVALVTAVAAALVDINESAARTAAEELVDAGRALAVDGGYTAH